MANPAPYLHLAVVDDDAERAAALVAPFAGWGWDAHVFPADTEALLAWLNDQPLDLLLLSSDTAERDAFAFLKRWLERPATAAIPVVITVPPGTGSAPLIKAIELGASDYVKLPIDPVLLRARLQNVVQKKLLQEQANTALVAFNEIEKLADDLRLVILPIGAALAAETEYERLLERIINEALSICRADAGVLYLAQDDGQLHYTLVRIDSLDLTIISGAGRDEPFAPLPLADPVTGEPNHDHIATYVALTGETVNLSDLHEGNQFDFSQLRDFEEANAFVGQSCLTVPVRSGLVVGALLLLNSTDPETGVVVPFDVYHQQVAESLASQSAVVLNNRLLSQREAMLLRYKRELEIARSIQTTFLPGDVAQPDGWEVATSFRPALDVAGDFYDVIQLPHGHVGLVMADVVGKGVTAALYMAIIRTLYRGLFQQYYVHFAPAEATVSPVAMTPFSFVDREALLSAVRLTNTYLLNNHLDSHIFCTLFASLLDPTTGRLLYVNAGHNPPYRLSRPLAQGRRAVRDRLQPTGPAIGLMRNQRYQIAESLLSAGEMLYLFTDGVTEARSPAGEEFGVARLETILTGVHETAAGLLASIDNAVLEHTADAPAHDDFTMLGVRRHLD